jgi:hypothetical protein
MSYMEQGEGGQANSLSYELSYRLSGDLADTRKLKRMLARTGETQVPSCQVRRFPAGTPVWKGISPFADGGGSLFERD